MDRPTSATNRAPAGLPALLTIEEVAERLVVSVRHVRRLVFERRIPYVKWGHLLRFDPADLAEWVDRARVAEDPPAAPHHFPRTSRRAAAPPRRRSQEAG